MLIFTMKVKAHKEAFGNAAVFYETYAKELQDLIPEAKVFFEQELPQIVPNNLLVHDPSLVDSKNLKITVLWKTSVFKNHYPEFKKWADTFNTRSERFTIHGDKIEEL